MRALVRRSLLVPVLATAFAGSGSRECVGVGDPDVCACWDVGLRTVRACGLACDSGADCVDEGDVACCAPGDRSAGVDKPGSRACAFRGGREA